MSQTSGAGGDDLRIRQYRVYPEPASTGDVLTLEQAKRMVQDFTSASIPLSAPLPPTSTPDTTAARSEVLAKTELSALIREPSLKNVEKRSLLSKKMGELGNFAKKHPWLTTGFVIAAIMILVTGYFTVQAFLGHDTIAILGAHPEIGAALICMMLFYSIYLINMCRRSAFKDDLEARVETHNDFTQKVQEARADDLSTLVTRMNTHIMKLGATLIETEQTNRSQFASVQKQYESANQNLAHLKMLQAGIEKLYQGAGNLPQKTQDEISKAMRLVAVSLSQGATLLTPIFPSTADVPTIPQIEAFPTTIVIPPVVTDRMKSNQFKQLSLWGKIGSLAGEIGPTLKNSPGSTVMFAAGLGMCALAGVAIAFYFHGTTDIYFFGTLSLTTIAPIAIYGFSLLYEGYNNATIANLQKTLEEMDKSNEERKILLESEQGRLKRIQTAADSTLAEFQQKWTDFQKLETTELAVSREQLTLRKVKEMAQLENLCTGIIRSLSPLLYGDTPPEEIRRILQSPAIGAITFAQ